MIPSHDATRDPSPVVEVHCQWQQWSSDLDSGIVARSALVQVAAHIPAVTSESGLIREVQVVHDDEPAAAAISYTAVQPAKCEVMTTWNKFLLKLKLK